MKDSHEKLLLLFLCLGASLVGFIFLSIRITKVQEDMTAKIARIQDQANTPAEKVMTLPDLPPDIQEAVRQLDLMDGKKNGGDSDNPVYGGFSSGIELFDGEVSLDEPEIGESITTLTVPTRSMTMVLPNLTENGVVIPKGGTFLSWPSGCGRIFTLRPGDKIPGGEAGEAMPCPCGKPGCYVIQFTE